MKKLIEYIKNPKSILIGLDRKRIINLNDSFYLKYVYKEQTGKKLNLKNPQTFNEKLQWLKIHDRKDIYTTMVDKYEAKKYVASIIGDEYIIPTLGVYDSFDDIDFSKLPNKFVIKCTHDSGGLVICRDKKKLNILEAKQKIEKCLKKNYYYAWREWPYKNVKPRIIIEKYMEDAESNDLKDYKLFCFDGKTKIVLVCSERFSSSNMCESFYDEKWNFINISEDNHRIDSNVMKPVNFELMKNLAWKLSNDIPFIRIDFYEINDKIYFGELTFFPKSGFEKFEPAEYDKLLGDLIDLKERKERK